MDLLAVTVNFKTPDMTVQAVRTLLPELEGMSAKVVIVDNDSQDGSFEKMSEAHEAEGWGDKVSVVASGHNGGFGYGNNYAMRMGFASDDPPRYVYLLNSDAFPKPGSIKTLVRWMDEHPTAGFAGSAVVSEDGEPFVNAFRFYGVLNEIESNVRFWPLSKLMSKQVVVIDPMPTEACEVDWVSGASMMLRRETLEQVGLFDETFFLYFEETELCLRAKKKGWPTYYVPEATVMHIGCVSTGAYNIDKRRPTYWFDSRRYYFEKQFGRLYANAADMAWLTGQALWKLRRLVERKPARDPKFLVRDFLCHKFGLPRLPDRPVS